MMPFEIIKPKQKVRFRAVINDCKRRNEVFSSNFYLSCVNYSNNPLFTSNSLHITSTGCIDQSIYIASFGHSFRHNSCLSSTINKSLDLNSINFAIDIKHISSSEKFRMILLGKTQIFIDISLLDIFFSFLVCLNIVRVDLKSSLNLLILSLSLHSFLISLFDNVLKFCQISSVPFFNCCSHFWVSLRHLNKLVLISLKLFQQLSCFIFKFEVWILGCLISSKERIKEVLI